MKETELNLQYEVLISHFKRHATKVRDLSEISRGGGGGGVGILNLGP